MNLTAEISFDLRVHTISSLKKSAYRLGDRCFAEIEQKDETTALVRLTSKKTLIDMNVLVGDFKNEVIDQGLREEISNETLRVRNLLLAQAFSAVSLFDQDSENVDFRNDPLGIGVLR